MIQCKHCGKVIETKNDLVVGSYFGITKPYHAACFAQRGKSSFFIRDWPVNSKINTLLIILGVLVAGTYFFANEPYYLVLGIIGILILTYSRISSYVRYEKKLPEGGFEQATMHATNPGACYYCGKPVSKAEATTARSFFLPKVYLLHESCFGTAVTKCTSPKLTAEPVNSKKFLIRYKQSPMLFIVGLVLSTFGVLGLTEGGWAMSLGFGAFGLLFFITGVITIKIKKTSDRLIAGCQ